MKIKIKRLVEFRLYLAIELVIFVAFPLLINEFWPQFFKIRHIILGIGVVYAYAIAKSHDISFSDMGLRKENFKESLRDVMPFTFVMILVMTACYLVVPGLMRVEQLDDVLQVSAVRFFFVVMLPYNVLSVPVQEFIFRGYYVPRVALTSKHKIFTTIWSALVFMFAHILYYNILFNIGTFAIGIVYARNFFKYKNIYSLMVSHAILGTIYSTILYLLATQ